MPESHVVANPLFQAYEYRRCGDLAMAQLHGTREFIGGGEPVPHPETATLFETSV